MSSAPRPQTSPSRSSPDHGSSCHSAGSASTVSVCESSSRLGPSPRPGMRATRFARSGTFAYSSHSTPISAQVVAQELGGERLVAGRVDRVEPDQLLEELDASSRRLPLLQRRVPRISTYSRCRARRRRPSSSARCSRPRSAELVAPVVVERRRPRLHRRHRAGEQISRAPRRDSASSTTRRRSNSRSKRRRAARDVARSDPSLRRSLPFGVGGAGGSSELGPGRRSART